MKKKWRPTLIVCGAAILVATLYWNWTSAKRNWPLGKQFLSSFDAAGFVSEQEALLAKLADDCRAPEFRRKARCVEWSMVHWAWTSQAPGEMSKILRESCASGSELSCERLRLIEEAERAQSWQRLDVESGADKELWPRISRLSNPLPISAWQELAVQGAVARSEAGADLACGFVTELPETLVCVTRGNRQMNNALGRVVSYIEQGNKLLSLDEHRRNPLLRFWQGSNLRRGDFETAVSLLRQSGSPLVEEERLWSWMMAQPWKYFLSFSAQSVFTGLPSHEFLHGLYFQSNDFRDVVEAALDDSAQKLRRLKMFVLKVFDTQDSYILNNEMQAYLLQHQSFFIDPNSNEVREQIVREFKLKSKNVDLSSFMTGY
jgi:hypothetical protein